MNHRELGRTGLTVAEIGFGAWGIGGKFWGPADDELSVAALRRALDKGVDFFDTAFVYGDGHSERLIARAFAESGRGGTVASKVPPKNWKWPGGGTLKDAFPADWVVSCTERTLKNLGVGTLDVQQFHVWRDEWLGQPGWEETWKALETLKRDGKIRFWGVSINDLDPGSALRLVASGKADTVQVIFNLFEQAPLAQLFPLCRKQSVGVIVRVPLDEGGLTGKLTEKTKFPGDDFRSDYFSGGRLAETVKRARSLEAVLVPQHAPDLAAAALKFCLSFPEVSTVIPGMRRPSHVDMNVGVSNGKGYPDSLLKELRQHAWKRER